MEQLKRIAILFDRIVEAIVLCMMAAMTVVVVVQVFTRKFANYVFPWSEEVTLLLLVWFSFLGIAIGFRERLHLAMDSFTNRLPKGFNVVLDKVIAACTFAFGFYLVYYGWDFTKLMHANSMPATGLPSSVQYLVMPLTGILVCIYSLLQAFNIDTRRHGDMEEPAE
ncbi:TRAP transporter small permease [Paenibacillus turpanensis]|uniref:TRAP transporter small permease n=1 Tax=Paenibacillus turpanensis TaxID=2689078 RepID=UPI00140E2F44|nr:TRAP transporter small permease [Paenibacillus turpanensis]